MSLTVLVSKENNTSFTTSKGEVLPFFPGPRMFNLVTSAGIWGNFGTSVLFRLCSQHSTQPHAFQLSALTLQSCF